MPAFKIRGDDGTTQIFTASLKSPTHLDTKCSGVLRWVEVELDKTIPTDTMLNRRVSFTGVTITIANCDHVSVIHHRGAVMVTKLYL